MIRRDFSLFQSHLDLAHNYWTKLVRPGNWVIDATCGNGHDTLFLAQLALSSHSPGLVIAMDKQLPAIENTRQRLSSTLPSSLLPQVQLLHQCHSTFPTLPSQSISLIVYNLGYLPKGDKAFTTMTETTGASVRAALDLISPGGAISISCYPGHTEGKVEEDWLLQFGANLDPREWSCCHHRWLNRQSAPSLLLIQRLFKREH